MWIEELNMQDGRSNMYFMYISNILIDLAQIKLLSCLWRTDNVQYRCQKAHALENTHLKSRWKVEFKSFSTISINWLVRRSLDFSFISTKFCARKNKSNKFIFVLKVSARTWWNSIEWMIRMGDSWHWNICNESPKHLPILTDPSFLTKFRNYSENFQFFEKLDHFHRGR